MKPRALLLQVAVVSFLCLITQVNPLRTEAAPAPYVALPGHVTPVPAGATFAGHASAEEPVKISVVLPLRNKSALDELIKRIYNPKDSLYGEYLTPEAFAEGYGATQDDVDSVCAYLQSKGLTITNQYSNRLVITATGPASAVEDAFKVTLNSFKAADGRTFRSIDSEPSLPADIAPKVSGIVGLDTSRTFHKQLSGLRAAGQSSLASAAGQGGYFGPLDVQSAYGLSPTALEAAGLPGQLNGSGQVVSLVELDGGYLPSDIAAYISYYSGVFGSNYTAPISGISVDGYPTGTLGPNGDEATLDVECVLNVAHGLSKMLVYESANAEEGDFLDTLAAIATDTSSTGNHEVAPIVSISYGIGEAVLDGTTEANEATIFEQMAAQGQSVLVATGDEGIYGAYPAGDTTDICAQDPAVQPYVTAVGGTSLTEANDHSYSMETTWNDSTLLGYIYNPNTGGTIGGGGISSFFGIPDYQMAYIPYGNTSGYSMTYRNVPDVALNADAYNLGYLICVGGTWEVAGGTSAAAPTWAGFVALLNQRRLQLQSQNIGFLNNAIYRVASSSRYANDFHDVTSGNIGTAATYSATAGYDLATGWGSFNGANLLADLQDIASQTTQTTLSSTPNPSTIGSSVEFTAIVSPATVTDGDLVYFFADNNFIGQAVTTSGRAHLAYSDLRVGTHQIVAEFAGDTAYMSSASNIIEQTVTALPASQVTLTSTSPNPATFGSTVTFTATVTPNIPDGSTITFYDNGTALAQATTTKSVASISNSGLAVGTHNITAVFGGNTRYSSSESNVYSQAITTQLTTTTSLTALANPIYVGLTATFTAIVSPHNQSQEGDQVQFYVDNNVAGSAAISGGQAVYTTSALGLGSHQVWAVFGGDSTYLASSSSKISEVVSALPTTVAVSSSPASPVELGAPVAFSATVTATGQPAPSGGSVTFLDGSTRIGVGVTDNMGVAAMPAINSLATGAHQITASYAAAGNLAAGVSPVYNMVITPHQTAVLLAASATSVGLGTPVTFTATINKPVADGDTVTFYDGSSVIGTATTAQQTATFVASSLSAGSHNVTAAFAGDATYGTSASAPVTVVVNQAATATQLSMGSSSAVLGAYVTLTASVSPTVPNGEVVTFTDNGSAIGTGHTASGTAVYATSNLGSGSHSITATYAGDANYAGSTSSAAALTITGNGPSYPAGINFFSCPYDYPGVSLDSLFGYSGVTLLTWNPTGNVYDAASGLHIGVGYWARFPQAVTLTSIGTPASTTSPFVITLYAGWNQIGCPFTTSTQLSSLTFGPADVSFGQATSGSNALIDGTFWTYTGGSAYTAASSLDPMKAYWVYAYTNTYMTVPAPNAL